MQDIKSSESQPQTPPEYQSLEHNSQNIQPLISVIIPVFNTESTLQRCIDSVFAQTYPNLEIILVDDGSPDRAGELCDRLAAQDSRVKVIHQPNQGLSTARNSGLEIARGDFVTFIDSDDTIDPAMISVLYRNLIAHDVKLSICALREVYDSNSQKNREAYDPNSPVPTTVYSTVDCLTKILCDQIPVNACGKLYTRDLFQDVKYPVSKLYEDVGTTYRLVQKCPRIAYTPWPGYDYFQNPASITHQAFRPQKLDLITLTDQMCTDIAASAVFRDASATKRTNLAFALKKRRLQARFSILRQLTATNHSEKSLQSELVHYIRTHARDILKNPLRTRRDVIATYAAILSPNLFRFLWNIHKRNKNSCKYPQAEQKPLKYSQAQ